MMMVTFLFNVIDLSLSAHKTLRQSELYLCSFMLYAYLLNSQVL